MTTQRTPVRKEEHPDDPAILRQQLEQASTSADLVLSSGGVSVGNAEFIKLVLVELGQIDFWRI